SRSSSPPFARNRDSNTAYKQQDLTRTELHKPSDPAMPQTLDKDHPIDDGDQVETPKRSRAYPWWKVCRDVQGCIRAPHIHLFSAPNAQSLEAGLDVKSSLRPSCDEKQHRRSLSG
ncbi:hypothetical protein B0T13DRAFT_396419, partial [Neurospora crassa]